MTMYGMNTETKANPTKYAEREFLPGDHWFNDALVIEVTRRGKSSFRLISGGFGEEYQPGNRIEWITDSGLGHRRLPYDARAFVVGVIRDNVLVAGSAPAKSLPLYVFK